jgi:hypothetical protein
MRCPIDISRGYDAHAPEKLQGDGGWGLAQNVQDELAFIWELA